jgi:DNA repair exonuclease SbcCD nuclease subunit
VRLLHTSDWHLGQTLHDFERDYEHQAFLDWLLDTLATEQVDVLLIAGDIFDNSNPSAAAQKQFYRFLTAAKQRIPAITTRRADWKRPRRCLPRLMPLPSVMSPAMPMAILTSTDW